MKRWFQFKINRPWRYCHKQIWKEIALPFWSIAIWLAAENHVISFNQLKCFISEQHGNASIKLIAGIDSCFELLHSQLIVWPICKSFKAEMFLCLTTKRSTKIEGTSFYRVMTSDTKWYLAITTNKICPILIFFTRVCWTFGQILTNYTL